MANDLIRSAQLLGGPKTIAGNKYSDLILESLGKVYVKTGQNTRVLNDVFTLLDKFNDLDDEEAVSKVIITDDISSLQYPGDGILVFDAQKKALYISYDERYILIIDSLETSINDRYVKKIGDTMTGTLTIRTTGAPLIVASRELVKNFNAEYLGGYSASRFAVKSLNEKIYGSWSFENRTTFNAVTEFNDKTIHNDTVVVNNADIITTGSIGSPVFASGFGGYGWRFDAETNMLTVDYLVVRKAMQVFELVVNQIKATNGSLWVTDSGTVKEVLEALYLNVDNLSSTKGLKANVWYIPYGSGTDNQKLVSISSEYLLGPSDSDSYSVKQFYTYKYMVSFQEVPSSLPSFNYDEIKKTAEEKEDGEFKYKMQVVDFFNKQYDEDGNVTKDLVSKFYDLDKTPRFFSTCKKATFDSTLEIKTIYSYYKYFGSTDNPAETNKGIPDKIQVVKMDTDTFPVFRDGDIVRCQKFEDSNIKYYDALVGNNFSTYYYILFTADSVFDKSTVIEYDEEGNLVELTETINKSQYVKTSQQNPEKEGVTQDDLETKIETDAELEAVESALVSTISAGDDIVRVGNLYDKDRQNSVYITSSESNSPYVQTMNGINRPDYSVLYTEPKFVTYQVIENGVSVTKYKEIYYSEEEVTNNGYSDYTIAYVQDDLTGTEQNLDVIRETDTEYSTLYLQNPTSEPYEPYELEHKYQKQYWVYVDEPYYINQCEIEKNSEGKYLSTYSNHVRARFGNLSGIYHELFGNDQPYGYGLYADNVFLTGRFFLSNGKAVADIGDEVKFELTNGLNVAGFYIKTDAYGKPYILLKADQVKIMTQNNTISALFTNGRIDASLIRVREVEAAEYFLSYVYKPYREISDGSYTTDSNGNPIFYSWTNSSSPLTDPWADLSQVRFVLKEHFWYPVTTDDTTVWYQLTPDYSTIENLIITRLTYSNGDGEVTNPASLYYSTADTVTSYNDVTIIPNDGLHPYDTYIIKHSGFDSDEKIILDGVTEYQNTGNFYSVFIKRDENGYVYSEIDTDYPYVKIDSTTGILTAREAQLTGGFLELYDTYSESDGIKQVKVLLSALEEKLENNNQIIDPGLSIYKKDSDNNWVNTSSFSGREYSNILDKFYEGEGVTKTIILTEDNSGDSNSTIYNKAFNTEGEWKVYSLDLIDQTFTVNYNKEQLLTFTKCYLSGNLGRNCSVYIKASSEGSFYTAACLQFKVYVDGELVGESDTKFEVLSGSYESFSYMNPLLVNTKQCRLSKNEDHIINIKLIATGIVAASVTVIEEGSVILQGGYFDPTYGHRYGINLNVEYGTLNDYILTQVYGNGLIVGSSPLNYFRVQRDITTKSTSLDCIFDHSALKLDSNGVQLYNSSTNTGLKLDADGVQLYNNTMGINLSSNEIYYKYNGIKFPTVQTIYCGKIVLQKSDSNYSVTLKNLCIPDGVTTTVQFYEEEITDTITGLGVGTTTTSSNTASRTKINFTGLFESLNTTLTDCQIYLTGLRQTLCYAGPIYASIMQMYCNLDYTEQYVCIQTGDDNSPNPGEYYIKIERIMSTYE